MKRTKAKPVVQLKPQPEAQPLVQLDWLSDHTQLLLCASVFLIGCGAILAGCYLGWTILPVSTLQLSMQNLTNFIPVIVAAVLSLIASGIGAIYIAYCLFAHKWGRLTRFALGTFALVFAVLFAIGLMEEVLNFSDFLIFPEAIFLAVLLSIAVDLFFGPKKLAVPILILAILCSGYIFYSDNYTTISQNVRLLHADGSPLANEPVQIISGSIVASAQTNGNGYAYYSASKAQMNSYGLEFVVRNQTYSITNSPADNTFYLNSTDGYFYNDLYPDPVIYTQPTFTTYT